MSDDPRHYDLGDQDNELGLHPEAIRVMWDNPLTYDPLKHGPPYLPAMKVRLAAEQKVAAKSMTRALMRKEAAADPARARETFLWLAADYSTQPGAELAVVLAFLRAEALVHQAHHWQTHGGDYYGDHLLFERIYNEVNGLVDSLAERTVGTGHFSLVDPVLQSKHISYIVEAIHQQIQGASPKDLPAQYVYVSLQTVLLFNALLGVAYEELDVKGQLSLGLDNLLQGFADKHEEFVYLLKQRSHSTSLDQTTVARVAARFSGSRSR